MRGRGLPGHDTAEPSGRWRILAVLAIGELLALSPWLSAAAVAPSLAREWQLDGPELALLTVAVQLGFVAGALLLAASGAADVLPAQRLFMVGAIAAAAANLGFAATAGSLATALPFRVATGFALAAVYPVGMKLLAGWFRRQRGLAIGVLVGALTIGSALPYLLRSIGLLAGTDWRVVVGATSGTALLGGVLVVLGARAGPLDVSAPRFSIALARAALRQRSIRLANIGYLGHMWELYAMWTWVPLFLLASFTASGNTDAGAGSLAAFAVVAVGGVGSVVAGALADRIGRTTVTMGAMAASGASAVAVALLFGAAPWVVTAFALVWGLTIVADSAQFSAAVSELAPPGTAGSALALQTALGFLITAPVILLVGALGPDASGGWQLAFALLALGPAVGVVAMWRLRHDPDAPLMASGNR